jgi:hypothetical protein
MTRQHVGHVFLGIDPGAKGAGAAIGTCLGCPSRFSQILTTIQFSKRTELDIYMWMTAIRDDCKDLGVPLTAILEKIWLRPTDGRGTGGKLMAHYGMLRGFLIAAGIRKIEVAPVTWTKKLGRVDPKSTSTPEKKRRNQTLAEELYPDRRIVRETADAFLLAEYGRRFHQ